MSHIMKVLQLISVLFLVIVAIVFFILYSNGSLTEERLNLVSKALRGEIEDSTDKKTVSLPDKEAQVKAKEESAQPDKENMLKKRESELSKTESVLALWKADLEIREKSLQEKEKRFSSPEMLIPETAKAEQERNFQSNIAIMEKMEVADVVNILKVWDDKTIAGYIRAIKPSKAAEIIRILSQNSQFTKVENGVSRIDNILGESGIGKNK